MKALLATAAIVLATSASAGTVMVSNTTHKDPTGFGTAFTDQHVYTFTLDHGTLFSGLLNTKGVLTTTPAVDIQSVKLSNLDTGEVLDWSELIAISWANVRTGREQWALAPHDLSAGTWDLTISGVSYANKQGNGYSVTLDLPEPGSVALAAIAIAGALVSSRRRKSA